MTLAEAEIKTLAGVPETVLPAGVAAQLPSITPGPPWRVHMGGLLWWHRPTQAAAAVLPPGLEARARGVTNAGFIRYRDTPVGPYNEVMAAPVTATGGLLGRVYVPLIAVDSVPSVHAGRAHWALPKVLATFSWEGDDSAEVHGDGWWLSARVIRRGLPIPVLGRSTQAQVRPDGRVGTMPVTIRGRGRLVTVEVDLDADASYAAWLVPGRHRGILLTAATMTVGAPRWSAGLS